MHCDLQGYHEKVPKRSQNLQLYFFNIVPEPKEVPIVENKNNKNSKEGTIHSHTPRKPPLLDFLQLLQKSPSLGLAKAHIRNIQIFMTLFEPN